jgi:hypothetical protein
MAPAPLVAERPLRAILPHEFAARASRFEERLPLAFDRDPETRWVSGDRQTGQERVELRFARRRKLARLRLEISPRSLGDYPRGLRIESSEDGIRFGTVLYEDAVLPALLVSLTRSDWPVKVDLDLPWHHSLAIRVRQIGATHVWYWAIDEMSVWETTE